MIFAADKLTAGLDVSSVVFCSILKYEQYLDGCSYSLREGSPNIPSRALGRAFPTVNHHIARSITVKQQYTSFLLPRAKQSARTMNRSSCDYKCQRRCDFAEDEQPKDNQSTQDHANQAAYCSDSRRILVTQSTPQFHIAPSQRQAYSVDDIHSIDGRVPDLKGEQCATRPEMHGKRDDNGRPSSIQMPEYRDDRDGAIIHFGVIGTHEGKTVIPKRSVHRNALDDLAHPYDEEGDFYVLDVNLDGDQIDHLLHYSEIYNAAGVYTNFLPKIADCLLSHP